MMSQINYDASALVMVLGQPDARGVALGIGAWRGSFLGAVTYVLGLHPEVQNRTEIYVDSEAGTGETVLDIARIKEISRLPDFPKRRS
jgi:hypothetical protein